jgi:hypothetical protein
VGEARAASPFRPLPTPDPRREGAWEGCGWEARAPLQTLNRRQKTAGPRPPLRRLVFWNLRFDRKVWRCGEVGVARALTSPNPSHRHPLALAWRWVTGEVREVSARTSYPPFNPVA